MTPPPLEFCQSRRVRPFSRARRLIAFAIVVAAAHSRAFPAEVVLGPDGAPGIAVGAVRLYPTFAALVEHTDNLLYAETDLTSSWTKTISPGLALEVPFSHSYLRVGYNLLVRNYGQADSHWTDTHTGLLDFKLGFGSGAVFQIQDDYEQGILETPIGTPGLEVPFAGQHYQSNSADIQLGHDRLGYHHLGFHYRPHFRTYLPPIVASYLDESGGSLVAEGDWMIGAHDRLLWDVADGTAKLADPLTGLNPKTQRDQSLQVGAGWELPRNAFFQFVVGPERQSYEAATPSTFRGLVGNASVFSTIETGTVWSVTAAREAYASGLQNTNYFVSDQLTVRAEMPRGTPVRFGGSAAYYLNVYPTDPVQEPANRRDRIRGFEAWMGLRNGVWVEWRLFVRYDRRSTNEPGAEYNVHRIGVGVVFGR